ncbi:MAG TPA: hypothetical protein VJ464_04270 [Blastocatellia bacterium]|nr:hypothetical protein [Blastocatellia bacterium]
MSHGPAKTPAEELELLQGKLQESQTQNANLAKEIEQLKSKVNNLGKTVEEINGKKGSWDAARKLILEKMEKESKFSLDRLATLKCHLSDEERQALKDKKEADKGEIDKLAGEIKTLRETTIPDLQAAYEQAKAVTAEKKKDYDKQVNLAQSDNDLLKDLASLHTLVEGEYAKGNYARMYFLLLEMKDGLDQLEANTPDLKNYEEQVNAAATAVSVAADAEAKAKADLDNANAQLDSKQKEWKDKTDNRRKNTLASIEEAAAPPPA